jgi:signal transduction histidine kinase
VVKRLLHSVIIYFSFFFLCLNVHAQTSMYTYKVHVKDADGMPVPNLQVWIQDADLQVTNADGAFSFESDVPLRMPIRADLENLQYELLQLAFFEDESTIRLTVERILLENEFSRIVVRNAAGEPLPELVISLGGKPYKTDEQGQVKLADPLFYPQYIEVNSSAHRIYEKNFSAPEHTLYLGVEELPEEFLLADTLMKSYEADFDRIASQLQTERKLFEEKNQEIRGEILKIRDNLIKEDDLSTEQKQELRNYLARMETAVEANSEALRQSEARTREAIDKLKQLISEKDSLNVLAQGRIQQMEIEKAAADENYRQKVILFASISVGLLLLALLIYLIAMKFREQKEFLARINSRLNKTQRELTRTVRELKVQRAQIEDHNQQLEVFVYKASHDIKGPLRSIMGLTQLGLHDVQDAGAQEYFQHIHRSTKRLDNLLMDLLKLTRTKQAKIEKEPLEVAPLVDEAIQSFGNSPNFSRMQFELEIEEGLHINSDEKMLYSVIQNFVENGIKYADLDKAQPQLKVSARYNEQEKSVDLVFEDNGLGIEKEHLPKIFDMFYKIDPQSDGTGLGLHIVKLSIEKLGGTLHVRSARGKGSCFTIRFYEAAIVPA